MYHFVEPKDNEIKEILNESHQLHSSDISQIKGFVMTDEELDEYNLRNNNKVKIRKIPKRYQNCIDDFITDYWDGNYSFERKKYIRVY